MDEKQKDSRHCWARFLDARVDVIFWMKDEGGWSDAEIANLLSMDEKQVYLIRTHKGNIDSTSERRANIETKIMTGFH